MQKLAKNENLRIVIQMMFKKQFRENLLGGGGVWQNVSYLFCWLMIYDILGNSSREEKGRGEGVSVSCAGLFVLVKQYSCDLLLFFCIFKYR